MRLIGSTLRLLRPLINQRKALSSSLVEIGNFDLSGLPVTSMEDCMIEDLPEPETADARKEQWETMLDMYFGGERFKPKLTNGSEPGDEAKPNVIPSFYDTRIVGCICEPDSSAINWIRLRKDKMVTCDCGYCFQLVDVPKNVQSLIETQERLRRA